MSDYNIQKSSAAAEAEAEAVAPDLTGFGMPEERQRIAEFVRHARKTLGLRGGGSLRHKEGHEWSPRAQRLLTDLMYGRATVRAWKPGGAVMRAAAASVARLQASVAASVAKKAAAAAVETAAVETAAVEAVAAAAVETAAAEGRKRKRPVSEAASSSSAQP